MKSLSISLTSLSINVINLFLAYHVIGIMLRAWDLFYLVHEFYNFKSFWAFMFMLAVLRSSSIAKLAMLENKVELNKDEKNKIRHSILTTITILIGLGVSSLFNLIFF